MTARIGIVVAFALAALVPAHSDERPAVPIGTTVADIPFKDIRYVEHTLKDLGDKKLYVLVFTSTTCPVVQRYLPRVNELAQAYADKGVQFACVNVDSSDTIKGMAYQAMEYGLDVPMVKDVDGELARAVGATHTPEVVILDSERVLRYRGRIDDQYQVGGVQPAVVEENLKYALEDLLAGREVAKPETPVAGCAITFPEVAKAESGLTFAKDVAPIIYEKCSGCHHPGTETPFSLITYDQVAAKARTIVDAVNDGRMPPWYAHPDFGTWENARVLSDSEKNTIVRWAESGRAAGDLAAAPEAPTYDDTVWRIGEPDIVLTAAEPFNVPAEGIIKYQYVTMPYIFPEDTWVQGIQVQPKNPRVVHHANVVYTVGQDGYKEDRNFLTGRVPGGSPAILTDGVAMLIPKGAALTVQIHYVTTGKPEVDQMSVGLRYAKEPIIKQARHKVIRDEEFVIPAGDPAHEVCATKELECDAIPIALFVHMHLRGKNSKFIAHYPDGSKEMLLVVPNYSFDWQMPYLFEPGTKRFPKGTKVECISQFDNSPFNPYNPDPTDDVEHGPQTFDEMMDGYMYYIDENENLNLHVDPNTGQALKQTADASAAITGEVNPAAAQN